MNHALSKIRAIRGMNDILLESGGLWEQLEDIVRVLLNSYGYRNLRTPILEHTHLFKRSIGEVTDIVEKEMYSFVDDLNGHSFTMRPEITAGIARAVIEHNLLYDRSQRVYTIGPVFRHERPQQGRYRQFHQINVEALGFSGPDIDAELISISAQLWKKLGLKNIRLDLNSLGQSEERSLYRAALIKHIERYTSVLDDGKKKRLYSNPLRILDSKEPLMQEIIRQAPLLSDFLGQNSKSHLKGVCQRLDSLGIEYSINPKLVRGLDYYNLTVFEWISVDQQGTQNAICGGGRYDGLIELLGGKPAPAVGFAVGIERVIYLCQKGAALKQIYACEIYIAHSGENAERFAIDIGELLRGKGFSVIVNAGGGNFKTQLRRASKSGARIAVILGTEEVSTQCATIRFFNPSNQEEKKQKRVPLGELVQTLKSVNDYD